MSAIAPSVTRASATPDDPDVLVVGAGHNGLTAACYLARAGAKVMVVEAAEAIGGCTRTANVIPQAPEHQVNLGAVDFLWIRASNVVCDLALWRFGYAEADVDPAFAYLHRDGPSVAVWRDPRQTAAELRSFSRRDADAYLEFARAQDALMDVAMPWLSGHPLRPPAAAVKALAKLGAMRIRRLFGLRRLGTASAVDLIERRFEHPVTRDLVAGMAAIAAPIDRPGSGLTVLFGGLVHRLGMSRPIGGSQALPDALARCLRAHGGSIRTGSVVDELIAVGGRVRGVRLADGTLLRAQAVLAGCDPKTTLTRLLPAGLLSERDAARARGIPTGNGGAAHLKVDLALSGKIRASRHAACRRDRVDLRVPSMFTGSVDELVAALSRRSAGEVVEPIPFWAIVPSATDPSQAPEGADTLYLWAGWMPPEPRQGWSATADALVASASRYFDDLPALEVGRHVTSPVELSRDLRLSGGQPWHVDFSRKSLGPLRPALGFGGYRTPVPGLFLTGAGTHPCPGVSCIPGQLAAQEVLRSLA